MDLALSAYLSNETDGSTDTRNKPELDPKFLRPITDSVKEFLLAGVDTTANTVAYCYYLLATHPEILKRVRAEHDQVFPPSLEGTVEMLRKDFRLVNTLPLTTAVIKETLRFFPPATALRQSPKDSYIDYNGKKFPTGGHMIAITSNVMHHNEDLFPDPHLFLPDRFLPSEVPTKYNVVDANTFRPFERGPRSCIGQELFMFKTRIMLLLTLRDFDFEPMYSKNSTRLSEELGGPAYQTFWLSAKPNEGLPMKFTLRR